MGADRRDACRIFLIHRARKRLQGDVMLRLTQGAGGCNPCCSLKSESDASSKGTGSG